MNIMDTRIRPRVTPQDFFLHLFSMIALYVSAASFLTIVFQMINIYIPDALDYHGYTGEAQEKIRLIRSALASLIILFPAFFGSTWYLNRMYVRIPEKQHLWIRKWLVYFTLFVASFILLGDLVALVNSMLNGEVRMRFYAKTAGVFFVAGSIFWYYVCDIRRMRSGK